VRDAEAAMCAYAQLAWLSHEKRQALARDRFLVQAGACACEAGWPDVAEECYRLITQFAPQHQVARFTSFVDAMKSADFRQLVTALSRKCPYERAEHMLQELGIEPADDSPEVPRGESVRSLLRRAEWEENQ